jgi:hypothetical protein
MRIIAACLTLLLLAGAAFGQAWNYRRDPVGFDVLVRADVIKELKLTPAQNKRIKAMRAIYAAAAARAWDDDAAEGGRRGMMERMRNARKELAGMLSPAQKKRLDEIKVQLMGMGIVLAPEFQRQLGLTQSQFTQLGNLYAQTGSKGPSEKEIAKVQTPQQLAKNKELSGKPFKH